MMDGFTIIQSVQLIYLGYFLAAFMLPKAGQKGQTQITSVGKIIGRVKKIEGGGGGGGGEGENNRNEEEGKY